MGPELFCGNGRADRQTLTYDESNNHFSQFCERSYIIFNAAVFGQQVLWLPLKYNVEQHPPPLK